MMQSEFEPTPLREMLNSAAVPVVSEDEVVLCYALVDPWGVRTDWPTSAEYPYGGDWAWILPSKVLLPSSVESSYKMIESWSCAASM